MEVIVRGSGLDWVIARAPILTDEAGTGRVKVLRKGEKGRVITRTDLAAWLVDQLESRIYVGQAVAMENH
jgi:NAD(P)H-binding